jgi:hypothetical protein
MKAIRAYSFGGPEVLPRDAKRWSYSTYPPSIQNELFYTDSEKFSAQSHRVPGALPRPPAPKRSCLCVYACAYARVKDPRRG